MQGIIMRKLFLAIASITLGAVSGILLADNGQFFVNGNVGQTDYRQSSPYAIGDGTTPHNDKTDTGGALRFGYVWHSTIDYGVEVGYADLGQAQLKSYNFINDSTTIKSRGPLFGGNLKYNFDSWYVSAHAGWYRSRIETGKSQTPGVCPLGHLCPDILIASTKQASTTTGTGEYLGLGAGYNFTPHFSLGLSYDNYHSRPAYSHENNDFNTAMYSVTAEYRF